MIETEKYNKALEEYLREGINYNANTIKNASHGDLEQLAADSFFYGFTFAKVMFDNKLKEEVERLRKEKEWISVDIKPTFNNDEDLYKYVLVVIGGEIWTNVC